MMRPNGSALGFLTPFGMTNPPNSARFFNKMTLPGFAFGFLLSTLYGVGFHFWRGGNAGKLLVFVMLGWLGFWLGQMAAVLTGLHWISAGPLYVGMATLGSAALLGLGYWLSLVRGETR